MEKIIEIDTEIYPKDKILESIEDFIEIGNIQFNKGSLKITGENMEETEEIFNEFMNYLVGLINE